MSSRERARLRVLLREIAGFALLLAAGFAVWPGALIIATANAAVA